MVLSIELLKRISFQAAESHSVLILWMYSADLNRSGDQDQQVSDSLAMLLAEQWTFSLQLLLKTQMYCLKHRPIRLPSLHLQKVLVSNLKVAHDQPTTLYPFRFIRQQHVQVQASVCIGGVLPNKPRKVVEAHSQMQRYLFNTQEDKFTPVHQSASCSILQTI